jgi:hypothetical protein
MRDIVDIDFANSQVIISVNPPLPNKCPTFKLVSFNDLSKDELAKVMSYLN